MGKLLFLFGQLLFVIGSLGPPPPVQSLEHLGEEIESFPYEEVSTELTLGRPLLRASNDAALGRPVQRNAEHKNTGIQGRIQAIPVRQLAPRPGRSLLPYVAQSTLTDSAEPSLHVSSRLQESDTSRVSVPSSSTPSHDQALFRPAEIGVRISDTVRLDVRFSDRLRDPDFHGWIRLPQHVTYIRTPWIQDVLRNMIQETGMTSRSDDSEIFIPLSLVAGLSGSKRDFFSRGDVYKIEIVAQSYLPGPIQTIELMFKHHTKRKWDGRIELHAISMWGIVNDASSLALLGAYRSSRRAMENLVSHTQAEQFVSKVYRERDSRMYLVPKD